MLKRDRQELYRAFNEIVARETDRERSDFNRRMVRVLAWCFLVPIALSIVLLFLVRARIVPLDVRFYAGWMILIAPVGYSIYFLGTELLRDAPKFLRRGGMTLSLGQFQRDSEWRESLRALFRRELGMSLEECRWLLANFRIDIENVKARTRYLTGLAGAVLFMIMQGIDWITDPTEVERSPALGPIEVSSWDLPQFIGLGIFLLLFYLSGSQTYHTLFRYLGCLELLAAELEAEAVDSAAGSQLKRG